MCTEACPCRLIQVPLCSFLSHILPHTVSCVLRNQLETLEHLFVHVVTEVSSVQLDNLSSGQTKKLIMNVIHIQD